MKCPFRKETRTEQSNVLGITETITEERYAECYGVECPFYYYGCKKVATITRQ